MSNGGGSCRPYNSFRWERKMHELPGLWSVIKQTNRVCLCVI